MKMKLIKNWPRSVPDYQWPASFHSLGNLPRRWFGAAAFHLAYLFGLLISTYGRRTPAAVVIRTDGIGDAILFEPALEALARNISPAAVHLWAPQAACQILRACPVIRKRVVIPRGQKAGNLLVWRSVRWRMRMGFLFGLQRFAIVIYPAESPEPLGNWIFSNVRATARWVNFGDTLNQFEWQRHKTHLRATRILSTRPGAAHELVRNAYLSTQFGGNLELRPPKIYLSAQAIAQAERQFLQWQRLEQQVRATGIAAIIPAGSQPINRYSAASWQGVMRQLWADQRVLCAIIPGPDHDDLVDEIVADLGDVPSVRLSRPMDVAATAALIGRLDGLITVDTGLAHAAIAQEMPTVVLRIGGDPGRFFPWPGATKSIVLNKSMPCEGCHNRCTRPEAECITQISVADVVGAYAKLCGTRARVAATVPAARWLKVAG